MQALFIFLVAAVTAAVLTPIAMACSRTLGFLDDPGPRKIHAGPTPLLGGTAVFAAVAIAALLAVPSLATEELHRLAGILVAAAMAVALGLVDDKHDLGAGAKLAGQVAIALVAAISGLRVTLFIPAPSVQLALTILWLVTIMNALNFLDNMNGLCAGVGAICAAIFGGIALAHSQTLGTALAAATAGALMGFLPWNFPQARIFLGDSGSHLTGFLLGALALLPHYFSYRDPSPTALPVLIPAIVLSVPLFDMVAVTVRRWRLGAPVYVGDENHLSHRLVRLGLSRVRAVAILYALTLVLGLGAVVLLWAPVWVATLVVVQTLGVMAVVTALKRNE